MISDTRALTASRPVKQLSGLSLWLASADGYLLCGRGGPGAGSLAAASAPSGCLLLAATAGFVRAGGGRQRRRWRAGPGNAQPHGKGGHLGNLALAPSARLRGMRQRFVQALLQAVGHGGPVMVSLTTRILSFFSPFRFQPCGPLADGSTAMLILFPALLFLSPLAP